MTDLSEHTGIAQFGRACQYVLEHDTHAPGSVDRVLTERMVRLCAETADFLYGEFTPTRVPQFAACPPGLRTSHAAATRGCVTPEERVAGIARFAAALQEKIQDPSLDAMTVGGTEEAIVARGSDWCTDVARVGCILCQVAGVPARLVFLVDTAVAYTGHVICEAYREGVWGAVDASTAVVYRHANGKPASTWELMASPALIAAHAAPRAGYTTVGQFRAAAIANYFLADRARYDYTPSGMNAYCRSILEMSMRGWPGGLRWLHGEERL